MSENNPTPSKRARGRPRKNESLTENTNQEPAKPKTPKKTPVKSTPAKKKQTPAKKPSKKRETETEDEITESETEEDYSDEEFKPDTEKSEIESETDEIEEDEENTVESSESDKEILPKKTRRSRKIDLVDNPGEIVPVHEVFNKDEKITEWEYELDQETKVFQKPKIPNLSDNAIEPFISTKTKSHKYIVYECPFCTRVFNYPLVFKAHLFSCEQNKNIPDYILFCIKCDFKAKKKQDMVNHYTDQHLKDKNEYDDDDSNSTFEMSNCKKNYYKATNYLFIDNLIFKFTKDFYSILFDRNQSLKKLDEFLHDDKIKQEFLIDFSMDTKYLKFEFNKNDFVLKSHEIYESPNVKFNFKIINLVDQITSFDWCPLKNSKCNYLAVSTLLNQSLMSKIIGEQPFIFKTLLELDNSPNLIYIYKFSNLNTNQNQIRKFAILNREIGTISQLKWRPDFGKSNFLNPEYLGYLLACGSDGNGYIYKVKDHEYRDQEPKKIYVYEPDKKVILRPNFMLGQCTTGDWSHHNGSVQIALGYSNGTVGIYYLNSGNLQKFKCENNELIIRPTTILNAHYTFVKTIKWSKLSGDLICTGSIFSREIKVWNLNQTEKALIDYEIFLTEFDLSLHSNDLYLSKEINLRGENHMVALNLEFNLFNSDKDESRAHSSLFYSNSTMSSINQNDFFNKFLLCNNDGSIFLSRSDNTRHWVQKNKLMFNSFSRIVNFDVKNDSDEVNKENIYNLETLIKKKETRKISIDLEHTNTKTCSKSTNNLNPIEINLNSLSKIRWNPNVGYLNWYCCSGVAGFLFIHQINELDVQKCAE
ncbi:unnamed protein product [Brachionus calyciflorus]|uniref:C2H2-type domain-containing protein n=1 Tax=Brachionus calyciflorus TaxID=104777 RepID=A0A813ZCU2_9BILA|nr:unnamed protein product [Brachionus calyciflorus]